jgi:beta-lactam-binding protein with PASTA domain
VKLSAKVVLGCAAPTLLIACSGPAPQSQQVPVPNVVGLSITQTHSTLATAGLRAADDLQGGCPPEPRFGQGEAVVIAQQPVAQTHVVKGSVVHLHLC